LVDIKDSADFRVKLQSNGLSVYQKRTHQLHQQATLQLVQGKQNF